MRNEYAHGTWAYKDQSDRRLGLWKIKAPEDRMSPNWVHKTAKEMQADAERLRNLQGDAQQLTRDLKNALRRK